MKSITNISEGHLVGQLASAGQLTSSVSLNQANDRVRNHSASSDVAEKASSSAALTDTGSIIGETCYGGSTAPFRGPVAMPAVATVSSEAVHLPPPPAHQDAEPVLDQTPGQAGQSAGEGVIWWKCVALGCGTCNSKKEKCCGGCQFPRPSAVQARRAKVHRQAEKQAVGAVLSEQQDSLRSTHERELRASMEALDMCRQELQLQRDSAATRLASQGRSLEDARHLAELYSRELATQREENKALLFAFKTLEKQTAEMAGHLKNELQNQNDKLERAAADQQKALQHARSEWELTVQKEKDDVAAHMSALISEHKVVEVVLKEQLEMEESARLAAAAKQNAMEDALKEMQLRFQKERERYAGLEAAAQMAENDEVVGALKKSNQRYEQRLQDLEYISKQESMVRLQLGKRLEQVIMDKEDALEQLDTLKMQIDQLRASARL